MSTTTRGPCPQCDKGPRDTALATTTDERGTVSYCHRCQYVATEHVERRPLEPPARLPHAEPLDWSDRAESIWRRTQPLRGSIAETYLRHRGCVLSPADGDLRYLAPVGDWPATLCARVTDAVTARPISLHLTPLAPDGRSRGDRRLLAGHRKRGGVIRLWPNEAVTTGLALAEGIETALASAHLYMPVWAAIDAGNLAAMPVLPGVEVLAIWADHDEAGIKAAQQCAARWRAAGRKVRAYRPRAVGEDAADIAVRRAS